MFNKEEIKILTNIAKKAGTIVLDFYHSQSYFIKSKEDGSELTEADLESNQYIINSLNLSFPTFKIVSEEQNNLLNLENSKDGNYFLIDPLDGTQNFIQKGKHFSINIAYIKKFKIEFGLIFFPLLNKLYITKEDRISYLNEQKIMVRKKQNNLTLLCSIREQSLFNIETKTEKIKSIKKVVGAYKFALIAEGKADLYIRKKCISAWDIGAGHAIIKGAGGNILDSKAREVEYKFQNDFLINDFVALGYLPNFH